jgi:hypothetical protein
MPVLENIRDKLIPVKSLKNDAIDKIRSTD